MPGAHAHERDAVAVQRVHVGLDLEHEAAELRLGRFDHARGGLARPRRRRVADEEVQQQLHAEVVHRRAEEHRCLPAGKVGVEVERVRGALHQLQLRSEEHTSELQSLMRISYAVFCLKKNNTTKTQETKDITKTEKTN